MTLGIVSRDSKQNVDGADEAIFVEFHTTNRLFLPLEGESSFKYGFLSSTKKLCCSFADISLPDRIHLFWAQGTCQNAG